MTYKNREIFEFLFSDGFCGYMDAFHHASRLPDTDPAKRNFIAHNMNGQMLLGIKKPPDDRVEIVQKLRFFHVAPEAAQLIADWENIELYIDEMRELFEKEGRVINLVKQPWWLWAFGDQYSTPDAFEQEHGIWGVDLIDAWNERHGKLWRFDETYINGEAFFRKIRELYVAREKTMAVDVHNSDERLIRCCSWAFGDTYTLNDGQQCTGRELVDAWNTLHGDLLPLDYDGHMCKDLIKIFDLWMDAMDKKMSKVTEEMKTAERDVKKGDKQ